jgi:[acyl-carrier-protein] S-malonyltransferase
MRDLVAEVRPDLLTAVCELVGDDPFERLDESTRFAQPAILTASLASWTRLADRVDPVAMAGHSLGELSALAAAGALDEHDALELVVLRGNLMAACDAGTMLAVIGGSPARAAGLAARHGVTVANDNAPDQVVLSGTREALEAARDAAKADGLRALMLDVAGAFHSPLMAPAAERLAAALEQTHFDSGEMPVFCNSSAAPFVDPQRELAENLLEPVRFRQTLLALRTSGVEEFVELGPGNVLAGLVKRTMREVAA